MPCAAARNLVIAIPARRARPPLLGTLAASVFSRWRAVPGSRRVLPSELSALSYDHVVAAKTGLLFTLRLIPAVSAMLARRGIDAAPLLEQSGVPLDAMRGEITAPLFRVQAFMTRAAEALGTDMFGIQLAEAVPSGAYGIAEFLVRSASTMDEALQFLCEFASLINPIANMRFVPSETEGCFHYSVGSQRDMLGVHLNAFDRVHRAPVQRDPGRGDAAHSRMVLARSPDRRRRGRSSLQVSGAVSSARLWLRRDTRPDGDTATHWRSGAVQVSPRSGAQSARVQR